MRPYRTFRIILNRVLVKITTFGHWWLPEFIRNKTMSIGLNILHKFYYYDDELGREILDRYSVLRRKEK